MQLLGTGRLLPVQLFEFLKDVLASAQACQNM